MFIAGSHTARDWFDDVTKVHAWGDLKYSERYQKVLDVFKNRDEIDTWSGIALAAVLALSSRRTILIELKRAGHTGHQ